MKVKIRQIEKLIRETDLSASKIAENLGISRQTLYERLRRYGIKIKDYRKTPILERENLIELYEEERLSVVQIAAKFNLSQDKIRSEMRSHGIARRLPGSHEHKRKHPPVSSMAVGDSFEIVLKDHKMLTFSSLYGQARQSGIRIVIRRKDKNTAVVKRIQG